LYRRLLWVLDMRLLHESSDRIPQERVVCSVQREELARDFQFWLAELLNDVGNRASGEPRKFAQRIDIPTG
ncbi:MAG: hypothetical protein JW990_03020, partial [Thermoleophilia bacterium]|nr:hypothetical protein [Thermoleophilia bacterium]